MAKRGGRPRGLSVNPDALEHLATIVGISKTELAVAGGISSGHLADLLHRGTGVSVETAGRLAAALRCPVAVIFPEVTTRFRAVKPGDEEAA